MGDEILIYLRTGEKEEKNRRKEIENSERIKKKITYKKHVHSLRKPNRE